MTEKNSQPRAVAVVFDDREKTLVGRAFAMTRDALTDCGLKRADIAMAMILYGVTEAEGEVGAPNVITSLRSLIVALNENSRGKPDSSILWN